MDVEKLDYKTFLKIVVLNRLIYQNIVILKKKINIIEGHPKLEGKKRIYTTSSKKISIKEKFEELLKKLKELEEK